MSNNEQHTIKWKFFPQIIMFQKSPLLLRASKFYISKVGAAEDSHLNPFTKAITHGGKFNGVSFIT